MVSPPDDVWEMGAEIFIWKETRALLFLLTDSDKWAWWQIASTQQKSEKFMTTMISGYNFIS